MNDDDYAELFKPSKPSADSSWDDVAREFQLLGKTLGDAVRAAWQRQDSGDHVRELQASLQSIIDEVNRAVDQGIATPEAQQARAQLTRLTESIRVATERTTEELRPELVALLRQANAELRRLTGQDDPS
jgi:ribosome recycling factor